MFRRQRAISVTVLLLGFWGISISIVGLSEPASAHNKFSGAYRKWPWKGGLTRTILTLPNQGRHAGQSNQLAIDVDMNLEYVYAVAPGTVVDRLHHPCVGWWLTIYDPAPNYGGYITYEHLLDGSFLVSGNQTGIVTGQPLAKSGAPVPGEDCGSGNRLHCQRNAQRLTGTFGSEDRAHQLSLEPISWHGCPNENPNGTCGQTLGTGLKQGTSSDGVTGYVSDNGGIGYDNSSPGNRYQPFIDKYKNLGIPQVSYEGSYANVGPSANVADSWSPCRNDSIFGSYFRYSCAPSGSGYQGIVQTFCGYASSSCSGGEDTNQSALMQVTPAGSFPVAHVERANLRAYTQLWNGQDWVYWIGYPTNDRYITDDFPPTINERQNFQGGHIDYTVNLSTGTCTVRIYDSGVLQVTYNYCD